VLALFDQLRDRLRSQPGRALNLPGLSLRESAVLVPLVDRNGVPSIVFTKRPATLRKHAGQFSFPGGARDESDPTPLHAALRESWEELGIPQEQVDVLGMLDESPTITDFRIQPFVGVVPPDLVFRPNPGEIALVLEVPLPQLLKPGVPRKQKWRRDQEEHDVYFFDYAGHTIWGATARILVDLLERAGGLPAFEALRGAG
jgi:8-oxo-dGTP pyrophosphatase MutT (NUDIX family)